MEHVYCLFCRRQKQQSIADQAPLFFPCTAINPTVVQRKWKQGKSVDVAYPLLPGYVFLFSDHPMDAVRLRRIGGVIRVLQYADGTYALWEEDGQIARWLLKYGGVLGISEAVREGSRIRVTEGPLKDCEGLITKVNKQCRRAHVAFHFNQIAWSAWMDFEWVDAVVPSAVGAQ